MATNNSYDEWSEKNPSQPIDHPEAGKTFTHHTAAECAENLERLAREGLIIPDFAIQSLKEKKEENEDNSGDD